jgi:hypothetical protein
MNGPYLQNAVHRCGARGGMQHLPKSSASSRCGRFAELRQEALAATPPPHAATNVSDLVELITSTRRPSRHPIRNERQLPGRARIRSRAHLQRPAAEALVR